jgi:hypothetical protein
LQPVKIPRSCSGPAADAAAELLRRRSGPAAMSDEELVASVRDHERRLPAEVVEAERRRVWGQR